MSKPQPQATERRSVMCRYQGPATGEKVGCKSCHGNVRHKKFTCQNENRRGEAVTFVDCQTCDHYAVAGLPLAEQAQAAPLLGQFLPIPETKTVLEDTRPLLTPEAAATETPYVQLGHEKLVIINRLAPGDCLVMTGVLESLAHCYHGRFHITALTTSPEVFENNPYVAENHALRSHSDYTVPAGSRVMDMGCPLLCEANQRPLHVLEGFLDNVRFSLKLPKLFLTTNRPRVYFSDAEKAAPSLVWEKPYFNRRIRYWLVNAGVKSDLRVKQWNGYQEVVDRLQGQVTFVQVGRTCDEHRRLDGAVDMVGKTDLRQLLGMVRHADGVLSGVSFLMHAAAALEKPAVILGGGIESRAWNSYPEQKYLDTIGQLDCCKHGGCGRGAVVQPKEVPIDPRMNLGVCLRPLPTVPPVGACMGMIRPQTVVDAIQAYYLGGVLKAGMMEL